MNAFEEKSFSLGLNSVDNPAALMPGTYQWGQNIVNKGGVISTRPGSRANQINVNGRPSALKLFTPRDGVPCLVASTGSHVYFNKYPFNNLTWSVIEGVEFAEGKCEFEIAVVAVTQAPDGSITVIDPFQVLMMFDGQTRTAFWDGVTARHLDPNENETPICTWAKWIGNRLWTMQGKKIRVSDMLNPLKFTEEDVLAEGGYFNLPDTGTGLGATPDFRSLIAFTDFTATAFQAGILNRALWQTTPDFQKVIFSHIGCAAGRSIVNQYGMLWWYSHGGLISLDSALQTYRSSEVKYKDQSMRRSRANFSGDISGICSAAVGNYLLVSTPSGDLANYHTWVMDGNPSESTASPAQWISVWTGIRPTQWAVGAVDGRQRCFCLSSDLLPDGLEALTHQQANVWEMFLQDRRDIGHDEDNTIVAKDIPCALETRFIVTGEQYSKMNYAELELDEITGTVQLDVFYCGRRGSYKNILSKQIVATVGSVSAPMTLPLQFGQYLPQKRLVKTVSDNLLSTDLNPKVETPFNRNRDKAFSILVKWTGQMSISKIRLCVEPDSDQITGKAEEDETTDRYIQPSGAGLIVAGGPTEIPITDEQSSFLNVLTPRWSEEIHKSLT